MFDVIVIFVHDGIYGVQTGAGMSNCRFIESLVKLGYGNKLVVSPVFTARSNRDFSQRWFNQINLVVTRAGGRVAPVQNGSDGLDRYGDVSNWKISAQEGCNLVRTIMSNGKRTLVLSFDTPFIGLMKHLADMRGVLHVHIPRSTAILHDPGNAERVVFEKDCFKYTKRKNTYVGATGDFMFGHLIRDYLVSKSKLLRITNGVLTDSYKKIDSEYVNKTLSRYGISSVDKFLLSYGRANLYKGFHLLIKAMGGLMDRRLKLLLIASTCNEDDEYVILLKSLFLKYRVSGRILTKFDTELPLVAQQADNLISVVVPSLSEPFGLIPIEVFANQYCQAPVIASNTGGLRSQVINYKTGLSFESGSVRDLRDKIETAICLKTSEKLMMKRNAVDLVHKKFDYFKNINRFMKNVGELFNFVT